MIDTKNNHIPFFVRLRAYIPHGIIFAISTLIFVLLFQFMIGGASSSLAEIKRVKDSPTNEIIFANAQNNGDTFYYLKNYSVAGSVNKNALSDVYMVMPNTEYKNNTIYFSGTLQEGTCAVSANIASQYGLKVGQKAKIIGTERYFTVDKILPCQAGLDKDYKHEGIVVLSYDSTLLDKNYNFVSFDTNGDGYHSLIDLVRTKSLSEGKGKTLFLYALIGVSSLICLIFACEIFIFKRRRADYSVLSVLGVRASYLYMIITIESLIKYTLPLLLVTVIYSSKYGCYRSSYFIPTLLFALISALICMAYSLILARRLYYVRAK